MALREAIESYTVFVESSPEVENYELKEDVVKSLSAVYLTDIQIVQQTEEGRGDELWDEATNEFLHGSCATVLE